MGTAFLTTMACALRLVKVYLLLGFFQSPKELVDAKERIPKFKKIEPSTCDLIYQ